MRTPSPIRIPRVVFVYDEVYDVYIGRGRCPRTGQPGRYGNLFSHKDGTMAAFKVATVEESVASFRRYCEERPELIETIKRELKGKVLGCWCNSSKRRGTTTQRLPCHGDVLLEIANS
jgi:hypothetical protein